MPSSLGGRSFIVVRQADENLAVSKNFKLCVSGSKEKLGIQILCIPQSTDTSSCILGKIYP